MTLTLNSSLRFLVLGLASERWVHCGLSLSLSVKDSDNVYRVKASLRLESLLPKSWTLRNSLMSLDLKEGLNMVQLSFELGVHFCVCLGPLGRQVESLVNNCEQHLGSKAKHCDPIAWEAKAEDGEFQASLDYTVT